MFQNQNKNNNIFLKHKLFDLFLIYKKEYLKNWNPEERIKKELDRIEKNWSIMKYYQKEKALEYVGYSKENEEKSKKLAEQKKYALKNKKYYIIWCSLCRKKQKFINYEYYKYVCEKCGLLYEEMHYSLSYEDKNRVYVKNEKEIRQVIENNYYKILFKCEFKEPLKIKGIDNIGKYFIEKDFWNKTISEIFQDQKIEKTISMINFIQSILIFNKKKFGEKINKGDFKIMDNIEKITEEYKNKESDEVIRYDYLTYLLIKKQHPKLIMISMFPNLKFPTNKFIDRVLNNNSTITKEWKKNADVKYQNLRRETNRIIGRIRANNYSYDASIMNYITKRNSDQKQQDKEYNKELKRKNKLFRGLEFEKEIIRENIINLLAFNTNSGSKLLAELFYKEMTGEIPQVKLCDRTFDESDSLFERITIKTEN